MNSIQRLKIKCTICFITTNIYSTPTDNTQSCNQHALMQFIKSIQQEYQSISLKIASMTSAQNSAKNKMTTFQNSQKTSTIELKSNKSAKSLMPTKGKRVNIIV